MEFNVVSILTSFAVLGNFFLAGLVFARRPNSNAHHIFSSFMFVLSLWAAASFLSGLNILRDQWQIFFLYLDFFVAPFVVFMFVVFSSYFPTEKSITSTVIHMLFLASAVFFATLAVATNLVIADLAVVDGGVAYDQGLADLYYILFVFVGIVYGCLNLWRRYQQSVGSEKLQTKYVMLGSTLCAVTITITIIALNRYFNLDYSVDPFVVEVLPDVGVSSSVLITLSIAYTVLRHRLFGIRIVIGRLLFWFGIAAFLLGAFYGVAEIEMRIFGSLFHPGVMILNLFVAFLIAMIFSLYEKSLERLIDRYIVNYYYHPQQVFEAYTLKVIREIDPAVIIQRLFETMNQTLKPVNQGIFLARLDNGVHEELFEVWQGISDDEVRAIESGDLLNQLMKHDTESGFVLKSEVDATLKEVFELLEIEGVYIIDTDGLGGIYILGHKIDGHGYTDEDIKLIQKLMFTTKLRLQKGVGV